jgi:hypothetical protein
VTVPTLLDAVHSLNERKAAAGVLEPVYGPSLTATLPILAGTDLTPEELSEFTDLNAKRGVALALALGTPNASASLWCDGLLTGLEFARLRDHEENAGERLRALRGALETVGRILGEAELPTVDRGDGGREPHPSAHALTRALGVVNLMLEGEAEDAR